jgi:type II secretory pathway predicted ATPase ExeA
MFLRHWGLQKDPFTAASPENLFLAGASHDEGLARLDYLVDHSRALGLMVGEGGIGKTTLLDVFARRRRRLGETVTVINLARVDLREFLWTLAAGLALNPADDESSFRLWRLVSDRLSERRYQQLRTTLIGDDAHLASDEMLAAVSQLLPLAGGESRLTIVLATREQKQRRIETEVGDSVDLRIDLEPWTATETAEFLRASLARAGVTRTIFDERASRRLHVLSRGVPRLARKIGELALAAGAAQELPLIDEATVEDVFSEIVAAPALQPAIPPPSHDISSEFETLVIR